MGFWNPKPYDQGKIKIAREYFMRADQGHPDILGLFHEDAEVYFPSRVIERDLAKTALTFVDLDWITAKRVVL